MQARSVTAWCGMRCLPPRVATWTLRSLTPIVVQQNRSIFVKFSPTPNPRCLMFTAQGHSFLKQQPATMAEGVAAAQKRVGSAAAGRLESQGGGGSGGGLQTLTFTRADDFRSPLAQHIFAAIDEAAVDEVTIGESFVTVHYGSAASQQTEEGDGEAQEKIEIPANHIQKHQEEHMTDGLVTSGNVIASEAVGEQQRRSSSLAASGSTPEEEAINPSEDEAPPKWGDIPATVCMAILEHAMSRRPAVDLDAVHPHQDTIPQEGDSEVVLAIKELVATTIRPQIQQDGGDIRFLTFDAAAGTLHVELLGACRTCKSSSTTLKELISRTVMHWIPEVKEVHEIRQQRKK